MGDKFLGDGLVGQNLAGYGIQFQLSHAADSSASG
jgi:hypothetical protein